MAASWQPLLSRCETILVGESCRFVLLVVGLGDRVGSDRKPVGFLEEPGFQLMVWLGGKRGPGGLGFESGVAPK